MPRKTPPVRPALDFLLDTDADPLARDWAGTPLTCIGCPFAAPVGWWALLRYEPPADGELDRLPGFPLAEQAAAGFPRLNHVRCTLKEDRVWAVDPICTVDDWRRRARIEVDGEPRPRRRKAAA